MMRAWVGARWRQHAETAMKVTRRQFIQIGGGTAGAAALGSGLLTNMWGLTPDHLHDPATDGDRVVPTFCELCFWKCGVLAHVKGGRVTKLEGNPAHPLSRGRLCPRGTGGAGLLYDPDRLRRPLVRREARGTQVFDEVDWPTALDHVAEKLAAIRDRYGPEALAVFKHGYGGSWLSTLARAFGTGNVSGPSYGQCRGPREVAFELTYGVSPGSPENLDLAHSRVITLLGSHLGENMHNTQVQDLARALDRGAELVVVDPRFSTIAGKARHWLPIKPGTDLALLLAWMHVIVRERLYDRDYVAQHTVGFEQLEQHLADKTPEWAYVRTSIPAETIVETARFIGGARPASLVHPGRHVTWYGDDTQRGRAVAILNALLGSWGRRGGFFLPASVSVPKLKLPPWTHEPKTPPDMPKGTVYPFANAVLSDGLRNASIPGTAAYDIKAWMVYGTNLFLALPERERTVRALQELDFVVAIDVLPAEICGWADVVLPECTYLERHDDLHAPPWREPYVALRQPVVEPQHDSKPGWWIAKELANRLGLGAWFPFADVEDHLGRRLKAGGFELSALKETGVIRGQAQPVTTEDGLVPTFPTPSGKVELYSQQLADAGLPPLPDYTPPEEPGPGELRLLFGRSPVHTFGRTTNNRFLSEVCSENEAWVNADVVAELGLKQGERVTLVNQDGVRSEPIRLKATQRIRPDCLYMVHGYGHDAKGLRFAHKRGADDARLCSRVRVDPVMGATGMNVNFVRVERWPA